MTFAPYLGGTRFQFCELAAHFRLQYLIGAIICLAGLLVFGAWLWAIVAVLCVVVNIFEIFPTYFNKPSGDNNKEHTKLRLVFANVLYPNKDYAKFIKLINREKPDIFIAQEVTENWLNALETLRETYPFDIAKTEKHGGGIALFGKFALLHSEVISLGQENRQSLLVKFKLNEKIITLYTFHPQAPIRFSHFKYRNQQLAGATEIIKKLDTPVIVVGDMNTTIWSPFFKRFLKETKLLNARQGFGLLPSFPVWKFPIKFLMMPIDHCFVSADISVSDIRTGEPIGSDHLPIIIDIQ